MKNISIVIFLLAALFAFSTIIIVDETEQIVKKMKILLISFIIILFSEIMYLKIFNVK